MKGYFACLDIEKTYDRVERKVLYAVLRQIEMDVKSANIICSIYMQKDTKAMQKLGDLETLWVKSVRGLHTVFHPIRIVY